ncbi:tryptophan--tRNA ligase [Marmoricola endophyticus]|uniref:Tryptophan--tRNA ligase n=1 Tax=Marmoricola endophyticus TaxID=2040280 RepID=A0A917F0S1_9ACTN|nr:tryptophan--tRNA ligase [Marmoricola endophyticus]GGF40846.1 tryptophan--tRNA ligase [Marmoricola endophyticus]
MTDQPETSGTSATFRAAEQRSAAVEERLAAHPEQFRMLTGDRPTGALHLGHYFGSLANRVRLQDSGADCWVIVADYQVITDRETGGDIRGSVRELLTDYLAAGIDERSTVFTHSAVPALNQLLLPFLSLVSVAELQRNPTVKEEAASAGISSISGLMLTYPVHQAADILFCKGNVVPVGKDQLPHIEQTRVVARRFNERYGVTFPEPDALLSPGGSVLGLDGTKMSKSRSNAVELRMSADETAKVLKKARTDSDRHITFDPATRPEVSNLVQLAAWCEGSDPVTVAEEIGDGGGGALKTRVTDAVNTYFAPLRARRTEIAADPSYVDEVMRRGNDRANQVADATLAEVRDRMGMSYSR